MRKIVYLIISVILFGACVNSPKKEEEKILDSVNNSIKSGGVWLDTEGKPIQAHGFSVVYIDGTYYWFGENKEFTKPGSNIWTYGIRCYTSTDFYNWEDKGLIILPDTVNPHSPLNPSQGIDRPHIIYNKKTEKYVCWIKLLGDDGQFMTVLTANNILGPYEIVNPGFRPNGYEAGDFDLYVDEETGKGYIWHERPHYEMICAELTDDFTSVNGNYSVHFSGIIPPDTREAPTHFMANGKHYLYTSGTTGYAPNESLISVFDNYHEEYTDLGNPHPLDTTFTSYYSQITDVIKIPGKKNLYVALADRWYPHMVGTDGPEKEKEKIRNMFKDHKPKPKDFSEVKLMDRTSEKRVDWDNTHKATYVWLPIVWENGVPNINWIDEWSLDDFE